MDKIIVPFEDVRGLGNIVSPKSLEDFEEYLSSVSKDTETINDVEMEVYTLVGNSNKIVLTADYNSIDYGDIVHLTAVVTDFEDNPITDLTVSFYDGETLLGTATCNQYNQEYYFTVYDALSTGIHNITAKATIDDIMVSSNIQGITVNKLTSSITLSGNDIEYGEDIELTGTLSIGSGYTVKIYQDDVLVDTVMTSANGSFSSTISNLNIGEYNFRAVFEETEIYLNSDDTVQLNVYSAIPTLSLSSSSDNLLKGESYTLSGNLSAGAGTVKLYNGDTLIDTVTANANGNFSKTITGVVDIYNYHAEFEGNENYGRCTSNDVNVAVLTANPVELTIVGNKFTQVRSSEIVLINSSNEKIVIDYGDNTIQVYTGDYTHNYSVSGTYNVKIYNVTSFGTECFAQLDGQRGSLTEITIPEGITTIGDYCFTDTDLTSLIIPSTVTSIGMYALQSGFTQITLPWTVSSNIVQYRSIWNYAGWASGFKFIIPEGTTSLYTAKNYPSNLLKELFDSIDLSSDKDIISYNGGTNPEHATLTAQLKNSGANANVANQEVTFEIASPNLAYHYNNQSEMEPAVLSGEYLQSNNATFIWKNYVQEVYIYDNALNQSNHESVINLTGYTSGNLITLIRNGNTLELYIDGVKTTGKITFNNGSENVVSDLWDYGNILPAPSSSRDFCVFTGINKHAYYEKQTANTNSSGTATVSYYGKGTGDLYIKCFSSDRMIVSKTFVVHDYWGYKASGSATFSSSSTGFISIYDLNDIGDCEITATLNSSVNKGFTLTYKVGNDTTTTNRVSVGADGSGYLLSLITENGSSTQHNDSVLYSANQDVSLLIRLENGNVLVKCNNNTFQSETHSNLTPRYVGIMSWNNAKTVTYKDLIVKKL